LRSAIGYLIKHAMKWMAIAPPTVIDFWAESWCW
jgi:hypothetical protein